MFTRFSVRGECYVLSGSKSRFISIPVQQFKKVGASFICFLVFLILNASSINHVMLMLIAFIVFNHHLIVVRALVQTQDKLRVLLIKECWITRYIFD